MVNGCGPKGWKGYFVPDHLLWLSIKQACDIHDYMYLVGRTEADREEADRVFRNNMLRIVNSGSTYSLVRYARRKMAHYYYKVVRNDGAIYFWADKNPEETFKDPKAVFGGSPALAGA